MTFKMRRLFLLMLLVQLSACWNGIQAQDLKFRIAEFYQDQQDLTFTVTATENTTADKREGKVVVSLTGLVAGESKTIEIPVVQRVKSQGPDKDGFSPDADWSVVGGDTHATISITRFSADEDWSVVGGSSAFKVTVTGYDDDSDWNILIR